MLKKICLFLEGLFFILCIISGILKIEKADCFDIVTTNGEFQTERRKNQIIMSLENKKIIYEYYHDEISNYDLNIN